MTDTVKKARPTRHPRDPFIDGAHIQIMERYKTSGLSGDEWRFSYKVILLRKGMMVASTTVNSMEYATALLACAVQLGWPELDSDPQWQTIPWEDVPDAGICCQPGCLNKSTRTYVMKKLYDRQCAFEKPNESMSGWIEAREFCDDHGRRGDGGLDDADHNYVCVRGKDWDDAPVDPDKVRESVFGGMIKIDLR